MLDSAKIKELISLLKTTDYKLRDKAISKLTTYINRSECEEHLPELKQVLASIILRERNQEYSKKYEKLLHLIEGKKFISPNMQFSSNEKKIEIKKIPAEQTGTVKRLSIVLLSILFIIVTYVLIMYVKNQKQGHDYTLEKDILERREEIKNKTNLSEKEANLSDNSELRYEIKFIPQKGFQLQLRTDITKQEYINEKLIKEVKGYVWHYEKLTTLLEDSFETRIEVLSKKNLPGTLSYFKFMEPGEKAFAVYTREGVLKDYRAQVNSPKIWYPESYLGFVYPRNPVGDGQKWGSIPGEDVGVAPFYFKFNGFIQEGSRRLIKVSLGANKGYTTFLNDAPKRKTHALAYGYYILDATNGHIVKLSVHKKYSYYLTSSAGKRKIFFHYHSYTK